MKLVFFASAGVGTAGSQIISLICLPFLTRLYSPTDFAPWALGMAFVVFLGAISTLRYDLAVVIERDAQDASALFWLTLIASLTVFVCVTVGMMVAAHLGWLFQASWVSGSMYLVGGWLLLFMLNQVWNSWHLRRGEFLIISIAQIGNAGVMNLIQFYGAIAQGGGGFWLVLGSIGGQIMALMVLLISGLRADFRPMWLSACAHRIRNMAWKHRRFVKYTLPYTLFGAIRERAPVLLLSLFTTSQELGIYSQAWRLANVPAGLTGGAVRPVLFHAVAERGLQPLEAPIKKIMTLFILIGAPLLAVVSNRPEDFFGLLLGEPWRAIGPFLAVLAFPALAFALSNWMDRLMDAAGHQHINLWTEIASGITSTFALVLVLVSGAGMLWAVIAQSAMLTLNYLFFIYLTYRVAGYDHRILNHMLALGVGLFLGVTMLLRGVAAS